MPVVEHEPWTALHREIDRGRRFDQPVTLMRAEVGRRRRRGATPVLRRLERLLRTIDSVWAEDGAVYIMLPGTSRGDAETLTGRLWRALPDELPWAELQVATFPQDALTPQALRAAVERAPRREPRSAPASASGQPVSEGEQ